MAKSTPTTWEEKLGLYEKLIDTHQEIERKGKSVPYTSVNGHMFSQLTKEGTVGLRLPTAEREKFMLKYNTALHESYGAVMREYVRVPDALLADTEALKPYLAISFAYASGLEPK